MKKVTILFMFCVIATQSNAQQVPGTVITPQTAPPKKVYEKPQIKKQILLPAAPKQTIIQSFETSITMQQWQGQLWWTDAAGGYSDGIITMQFNKDKTVSWSKQGVEVVTPTPGTYTINKDTVAINFKYAPYTYSFKGVYNNTTGEITGTYTQINAAFANAPAYYKEGTIAGTFKLLKK